MAAFDADTDLASMGDCMIRIFPVGDGFFSSPPSVVGSAVFLAAFAILIPINWWAGMHWNTPIYSLTIVAGLVFEVIGYIGRILLNLDTASVVGFVLYMLGTIMGPTFITSAVYQILPHIVVLYGKEFTLVSQPAYFGVFFMVLDLCTMPSRRQAWQCQSVERHPMRGPADLTSSWLVWPCKWPA